MSFRASGARVWQAGDKKSIADKMTALKVLFKLSVPRKFASACIGDDLMS